MINETNDRPQDLSHTDEPVVRPVAVAAPAGGVGAPVPVTSDTQFLIHLSPEAADELNQLMAQTGDSPTQLFRKALGLYKVTKQAIREGKAVGIAETADSLESRFVGI
jgi:hypothetical protein